VPSGGGFLTCGFAFPHEGDGPPRRSHAAFTYRRMWMARRRYLGVR